MHPPNVQANLKHFIRNQLQPGQRLYIRSMVPDGRIVGFTILSYNQFTDRVRFIVPSEPHTIGTMFVNELDDLDYIITLVQLLTNTRIRLLYPRRRFIN